MLRVAGAEVSGGGASWQGRVPVCWCWSLARNPCRADWVPSRARLNPRECARRPLVAGDATDIDKAPSGSD